MTKKLYEKLLYFPIILQIEALMIVTNDIENAAYLCAKGEDVTFAITKENEWSLFLFCFYQMKYKTLKDFNNISFRKKKDILYLFLKFIALISFGKYNISFDYM